MALNTRDLTFEHRLGQQLDLFSQLTENLTLRILHAEERLLSLEKEKSLPKLSFEDSTNQSLKDSEERVKGIKNLLALGEDKIPSILNSLPVENTIEPNEVNLSNQDNFLEQEKDFNEEKDFPSICFGYSLESN